MAGSYYHLRDKETGMFRFDGIENLRDAYEACAECFFLIDYLTGNDQVRIAAALDDYYRACRSEPVSEPVQAAFQRASGRPR